MASSSTPGSGKRRRRLQRFKEQPRCIVSESTLPKMLSVVQFAEARVQELESMANAIRHPTELRRVFQTLPRHMRRRAMSHNSKRLPVRLREAAEKEFESQERTSSSGRASRKHRRRPSNLRSEFSRRQCSIMWLETHLWHAKRMHMNVRWGYRLAESPCEKSARATFRSMARGCLISDVSYIGCAELCGERESILAVLSPLVSLARGQPFAGVQYLGGGYEGKVNLYRRHGHPTLPIGPVSFLWQPCVSKMGVEEPVAKKPCFRDNQPDVAESCSTKVRLWLWIHGAVWQEVWDELEAAIRDRSHGVKLTSLRDSLARFRLSGVATLNLLQAALQCADVSKFDMQRCQEEWWAVSSDWRKDAEDASVQWAKLKGDDDVPPQAVVALTVHDPRLNLPKRREKITGAAEVTHDPAESVVHPGMWTEHVVSSLWDEEIRRKVASTKLSEHVLNERRGELHSTPDAEPSHLSTSLVPLILSHQAKDERGFGSGWDVILPRCWAMAFWISFVYRGACAGGLREIACMALESGSLCFPADWPDCAAGKLEALTARISEEEAYLRRPPSKRTDYSQLCVQAPFYCNWDHLATQWSPAGSEKAVWCVLRDVDLLHQLNQIVCQLTYRKHNTKWKVLPSDALAAIDGLERYKSSLVPCCLTICGRGTPEKYASVSLPLHEDWQTVMCKKGQGNLVEELASRESAMDVPCAGNSSETIRCSSAEPSRRVMGFVVRGGFSLRRGAGFATAFCALPAVLHWLRVMCDNASCKATVLVRNSNTTHYRFAHLTIITDPC